MGRQHDNPRRWLRRSKVQWLIIGLPILILLGLAVYWIGGTLPGGWFGRSTAREPLTEAAKMELIVVDEHEPWLLALASPVAALLRRGDKVPLLLAVSTPSAKSLEVLLEQVQPECCRLLTPDATSPLRDGLLRLRPETIATGRSPMEASVLLAKRFWTVSSQVVVAPGEDAEAVILGSALAARLKAPLLLRDASTPIDFLCEALAGLEVQRVFVSVSDATPDPDWAVELAPEVNVLRPHELQRMLIAASGAAKVRTIVLARTPEKDSQVGATAWLAPYLALVREAPVVLCHSDRAGEAEQCVEDLVDEEGVLPRSVTILADYKSIGTHLVHLGDPVDEKHPTAGSSGSSYKVETEPCIPTDFDRPVPYGVGRIPYDSLQEASTLFARGVLRQHLLARQAPRVLMVANANPDPDDAGLPLCEAIGRVTAEELKNCGIQIEESYHKPANSTRVVAAAGSANLIIYEGHGRHQRLFREAAVSASGSPPAENTPRAEAAVSAGNSPRCENAAGAAAEGQVEGSPAPNRNWAASGSRGTAQATEEEAEPEFEPGLPPVLSPEATRDQMRQFQQTTTLKDPLMGLPVVILQACVSSDIDFLDLVHRFGGVGLLGSSTSVHSGSGSALVKAFVNGLLYRSDTVGEALRDAQNYFFCLQELKVARGHQQQAKAQRVALCFRLWGDPELQVFPHGVDKPTRPPVSITWDAADKLTITLPSRRLAESRTNAYVARMFPGSEAAGMVKRVGDNAPRKLAPVYYFRLPLPEDFPRAAYATLACAEDTSNRTVFRVDPLGRFLYVLYFPRKEAPRETFLLQFMRPDRRSR